MQIKHIYNNYYYFTNWVKNFFRPYFLAPHEVVCLKKEKKIYCMDTAQLYAACLKMSMLVVGGTFEDFFGSVS